MKMKRTILIVDDEFGSRESLRMILKPLYHIEVAADGRSALEIMERTRVDLVTLDLTMPDLPGEDVLKIIRRKFPATDVIIVSGGGTLKSAIDAIRFGASDFIVKPFKITDLLNTINAVLSKKRRKEELKEFLNGIGDTFGMDLSLPEVMQHLKILKGTLQTSAGASEPDADYNAQSGSNWRSQETPPSNKGEPMPLDKRRCRRIPFKTSALIAKSGDPTLHAVAVRDICKLGIGIYTTEMFHKRDRVFLELTLPNEKEEMIQEVFPGEVVWAEQPQGVNPSAVGIKFHSDHQRQNKLDAYVQYIEKRLSCKSKDSLRDP